MMRVKKKNLFILIVIVLLLISLIILGITKLINTGSEEVYKEEKNSKLVTLLNDNNLFKEKYAKEYENINYIDKADFLENINLLLDKGYKGEEINNIYKMSDNNIGKILNEEYLNIIDYYTIKNFNIDNYSRYEEYKNKNTNLKIEDIVTKVNIDLDQEFYTYSKEVQNKDDLLMIVNKYNYVPKDYVPKNLVILFDSKNGAKMVDVAAEAFKELVEDAKKNNITLESTTAYRSYDFQNTLYTNYVAKDGVKEADTYSARPGYSEHQTGLAVDLNDPTVSGSRLDDKDYKWLLDNAHKYGFIIRYQKEIVPITGYIEEPWHIRYIGVEHAKGVHDTNLSYEEYYDLYIEKY